MPAGLLIADGGWGGVLEIKEQAMREGMKPLPLLLLYSSPTGC